MTRHYAKYNNEEYIVLGHNPKYNNCLLVRMVALPIEEQADLRAIATSEVAQRHHYYLLPVLATQTHRSGRAWEQYLLEQVNRRGGPLITLPLKDIQDSLDPEQKAVWKGYGKPNPSYRNLNPSTDLSADGRALQEVLHPGYSRHPAGTAVAPPMIPPEALGALENYSGDDVDSPIVGTGTLPGKSGLDEKFDSLASAIAEEGKATRGSLDRLASVLERLIPAEAEKKAAKARKGEQA